MTLTPTITAGNKNQNDYRLSPLRRFNQRVHGKTYALAFGANCLVELPIAICRHCL